MSKGSTSAPAWTPTEVAERCKALGARVELKGTKYRVYPPAGGGPVFFNAQRETNGSHLPNVLRDLRRFGLDLMEAERELQERLRSTRPRAVLTVRDRISPETQDAIKAMVTEAITAPPTETTTGTTTEKEPAMAAPKPTPPRSPTPITFNVRQELAKLREAIERQGDTAMEMLADAERRIQVLESEVAELRSGATLRSRPPSITEITRSLVLGYFVEHPKMKMTPLMVDANLDDQLPVGRGTTTVAGACRDLSMAGKLQGGGPRSGLRANHGLYWYDPAAPAVDATTDTGADQTSS